MWYIDYSYSGMQICMIQNVSSGESNTIVLDSDRKSIKKSNAKVELSKLDSIITKNDYERAIALGRYLRNKYNLKQGRYNLEVIDYDKDLYQQYANVDVGALVSFKDKLGNLISNVRVTEYSYDEEKLIFSIGGKIVSEESS